MLKYAISKIKVFPYNFLKIKLYDCSITGLKMLNNNCIEDIITLIISISDQGRVMYPFTQLLVWELENVDEILKKQMVLSRWWCPSSSAINAAAKATTLIRTWWSSCETLKKNSKKTREIPCPYLHWSQSRYHRRNCCYFQVLDHAPNFSLSLWDDSVVLVIRRVNTFKNGGQSP